jgi:hypothetical protein
MPERIHIVVDRAEKERYRRMAERQGKSLSERIREAAQEKLTASEGEDALTTVDALRAFFQQINERERGREPDWETHRQVIERSISGDSAPT